MGTVMKKARTVHECEGKPDYMDIVHSDTCGEWFVRFFHGDYGDSNETCYMVVDVTVPVSYCPFCGEELR